jgi:hypothetical protein
VVFGDKPKRVEGGAAIPDGFRKTIRFTEGDSTHIYYFPNEVPNKKWTEYRIK